VREALRARGETPSLDAIRSLFPPTTGDAAFDPMVIQGNIDRLVTTPEVNTGHPFLDLAVKTGLAFIDATFQGDHPKYGVKHYAENEGLQASYTNYRYWPELLASGELPAPLANRIVEARLAGGGQFCGMTRFNGHLDDWPLADYLYGLWRLGRKDDFLLSLYGHVCYHQAAGHLTAYEQVTLPPSREMLAPYCLPCQLVATRAARLLVPASR
jgi:hypothetical protein